MASKLTKAAQGQDCTAQIHPYCNGNSETTVFAHAPSEDKGMGIKSPNFWGADMCSDCHDCLDGRRSIAFYAGEKEEIWNRAIFRTIKRRIEQGLIKVAK